MPLGGGGYLVITQAVAGDAAHDLRRRRTIAICRRTGANSKRKAITFTGDGCKRDEDGYYWMLGRVDDVMNVVGPSHLARRKSRARFVDHPARRRSRRRRPRRTRSTGQAIAAFVTLKSRRRGLADGLQKSCASMSAPKIGAFARARMISRSPPELPKTRSGKIMRRLLRDVDGRTAARRHDHAGRRGGGETADGTRARASERRVDRAPLAGPRRRQRSK